MRSYGANNWVPVPYASTYPVEVAVDKVTNNEKGLGHGHAMWPNVGHQLKVVYYCS